MERLHSLVNIKYRRLYVVAQAFIPAAREAKISQDNLVRPYLKKANGSAAAASVDVLTLPLNVAL